MNCPKCKIISVFDMPFQRVKPIGDTVNAFWCESCVKKYEPELYKNNKDEEGKIDKDLKAICYL